METIKTIRTDRKKKKTVAVIAVILAAIIVGVASLFACKSDNNNKPEIISDQGEIVNYFSYYIDRFNVVDEETSIQKIQRAISADAPTDKDFYNLIPKQTVKIIKIVGEFWWIPSNHPEETVLNHLSDTFETTVFTENFIINKNEEMKREVEITPSSCEWLKEIMTPTDVLWFMSGDFSQKNAINLQIKNLQIFFSLA